jgi:NAD+ kinase
MRFGISGNIEKAELPCVVERLIKRFQAERTEYVVHDALLPALRKKIDTAMLKKTRFVSENKLTNACDIVISLGGDGTILRLARSVSSAGKPILGINLGKLGFLAEVSLEEMDNCLSEILKGEYTVEERSMLETKIGRSVFSQSALNDVVINCSGSSRMFSVMTYVNDQYLSTFRGDGVIVATPTGSTAYALANGGPIVMPKTDLFLISPICPHMLTARTVVVPDESVIRFKVDMAPGKVHVAVDGQPQKFVDAPVEIVIQKSVRITRLVKRMNTNYYDVLRRKLNWGKDIRIG